MPATRLPEPWRRVDDGSHGKTGARYHHPAGYVIEHCGHPTALWPYALYGPDGEMIHAVNGRAFRTVQLAGDEVARRLIAETQIGQFAQAVSQAPPVAEAPFALRAQVDRRKSKQGGLF